MKIRGLLVILAFALFGLAHSCMKIQHDASKQFDFYDLPVDTTVVDSLFDSVGAREIKRVVVHCTASFGNLDSLKLMGIFKDRWGRNAKPGYHFAVFKNGDIVVMNPLDEDRFITSSELVWGAKGYNSTSIHIAYDGGIDRHMNPLDTRTTAQKTALECLVDLFKCRYPDIVVIGHRNISDKACPSFDAMEEYFDGSLLEQSELFDTLRTAVDSTERSLK